MTRPVTRRLAKAALPAVFMASALSGCIQPPVKNEPVFTGEGIPYTEFVAAAKNGNVARITVMDRDIKGERKDGSAFVTRAPQSENVVDRLEGTNVEVSDIARPLPKGPSMGSQALALLLNIAMMVAVLLIVFWIIGRLTKGKGGMGMGGFGQSKAKVTPPEHSKVRFDDVAGVDPAKAELAEMVDFLKNPRKYQKLGSKIPKGALLVGPPGTGKTLLAKAVAGEAGVPFLSISGSDFVEMYVGVGASRVRSLFEQAKKAAPCIIFIDEIDAVGGQRGSGIGSGGNDEREQTLNQLLVEMDGFEENSGIIILAATNQAEKLDKALKRPGRFDRQVQVPLPDIAGREKILQVHMKKVPLATDVDVQYIARGTPGFSGADLANLVNEAALCAARASREAVTLRDFEDAKDRIIMGAENRTLSMSDDEKKLTAWHEAGHALVSIHEKDSDPIHKATIIPRGGALGMVVRLPERDRVSLSRAKLQADLAVAMGGRVAEEMLVGNDNVTTGASGDIQQATNIAKLMVMDWGLSEKLGNVKYSPDDREIMTGSGTRSRHVSEKTAEIVDAEVRGLVDAGYVRAQQILTDFRDQLENIANALLEYETLSGSEVRIVAEGGKITRAPSTPAPEEKADEPRPSVPVVPRIGRKNSDGPAPNAP